MPSDFRSRPAAAAEKREKEKREKEKLPFVLIHTKFCGSGPL